MNSRPWTPGPWHTERHEEAPEAFLCIHDANGNPPTTDADTRLMAAAPEMAVELEHLFERYGHQSTADLLARIREPA